MHVSTPFSVSKEITHCWSPDLPGSLEAMIMQVLSKGKHLVRSLYRAYTFLQRTGRQKYVSTWERNYDWAPAHSLQVTVWIVHARTNSTRTCVHSVKERAEGSTEDTLDLGENKEWGWNPILGNTYYYKEWNIHQEELCGRLKVSSPILFSVQVWINFYFWKIWYYKHPVHGVYVTSAAQETLHYCGQLSGTCFSPLVSARMLVLLLHSWCSISPNQKAKRR